MFQSNSKITFRTNWRRQLQDIHWWRRGSTGATVYKELTKNLSTDEIIQVGKRSVF